MGVTREAYDGIVTSGDVTRGIVGEASRAGRVSHRAGARPHDLQRPRCAFTTLEEADCVVCSGLFDDEAETPEDYREILGSSKPAS